MRAKAEHAGPMAGSAASVFRLRDMVPHPHHFATDQPNLRGDGHRRTAAANTMVSKRFCNLDPVLLSAHAADVRGGVALFFLVVQKASPNAMDFIYNRIIRLGTFIYCDCLVHYAIIDNRRIAQQPQMMHSADTKTRFFNSGIHATTHRLVDPTR